MHDVFISYSSVEYAEARAIRGFLERNGITCWMAPESIPAGADYAGVIPRAIADCRAFVLILSPNAQASVWVRKELDVAIGKARTVIPFMISKFTLNDTFDFLLSDAQWCYAYSDRDGALRKLLDGVKASGSTYRYVPPAQQKQPTAPPKQPATPPKQPAAPSKPVAPPKQPVTQQKPPVKPAQTKPVGRVCKKCGKAGMTLEQRKPNIFPSVAVMKPLAIVGLLIALTALSGAVGSALDDMSIMGFGFIASLIATAVITGKGIVDKWIDGAIDGKFGSMLAMFIFLTGGVFLIALILGGLIYLSAVGQEQFYPEEIAAMVTLSAVIGLLLVRTLRRAGKTVKVYKCTCGAVERL